jgi:hypothetical protein
MNRTMPIALGALLFLSMSSNAQLSDASDTLFSGRWTMTGVTSNSSPQEDSLKLDLKRCRPKLLVDYAGHEIIIKQISECPDPK